MIITKKSIPRRTVIRGLGVSVALPLLDGMVPAFSWALPPVRRFCAIYVPNGMSMPYWTPEHDGDLEMTPILQPLAAFRDRLLLVTGCDNAQTDIVPDGGTHPRAQTGWLTGVPGRRSEGADFQAATSLDQLIARDFAKETQLTSLEVALEDVATSTSIMAFPGYSHIYISTISWRTPTMPLPMEMNPRVVFERLFGASDGTDRQARLDQIDRNRSLLDFVTGKIARLRARLGQGDRAKLEEHLESVRDVERRIQKAEAQVDVELPVVDRPRGVPGTFEEHAKLMFDLLVLAYKTDMTRVTSYLYGRESTNRVFPEIGVPEPWHPISHHVNDPEKLQRQAKLNTYHTTMFQHFLEQLAATPEGDGTLLDNTMVLYGSGMSDSNLHTHLNLPTLLVAGRDMPVQTGRHLRVPKGTPFSNLQLTLLDKMNVRGVEQFGNSTGTFEKMLSL